MKSSGLKLPKVHGVSKSLDPNIQPEKQKPLKGNKGLKGKPYTGQGRAGMRRRRPPPINQAITQALFTVLLTLPKFCADKIIMLYHPHLFVEPQNCQKIPDVSKSKPE